MYKFSDNKLNLHDISSVDKLYDGDGREREPINSSTWNYNKVRELATVC